jgi:hypothetical protein
MHDPKWKSTSLAVYAAAEVPAASGVYILLHMERMSGVPIRSEPLYVGKTANLRRRLC